MRNSVFVFVGVVALAPVVPTPAFASDRSDVLATVKQADDAFNNNDMKAWNATCGDQVVIIDDFAPHVWQGANACGDWWSAFDALAKKSALTDTKVRTGTPWHVTITGDRAYVVEPAIYTYKANGKPSMEHGVWTVTLQKQSAGWRITGSAWAQH